MKLWVLSDLHIDSAPVELGDHPEHDAIVMSGDLCDGDHDPIAWLKAEFSDIERSRLIFVPGNHEAYGLGIGGVQELLSRWRGETGMNTLDRQFIELGGIRFVGATMWSPLSPNLDDRGGDLHFIPDFSGEKWRALHAAEVEWLEATVGEGDVVVTHHAPSWEGLKAKMQQNIQLMALASGYYADMKALIEERRPALWVHGHTHIGNEYEIGGVRVVSNALGRGSDHHFRPDLIVEVDPMVRRD